jgi:hypothetical protein
VCRIVSPKLLSIGKASNSLLIVSVNVSGVPGSLIVPVSVIVPFSLIAGTDFNISVGAPLLKHCVLFFGPNATSS